MVKDTLQALDSSRIEQLETELAAARRKLKHRERLHRAHMQLAARVHQSLLPRPVRHPRVDLDTRYVPVEGIGGDYCQVLFPDDATCYVTICDVAGHGVGPALLATRVSSEVRRLARDRRRPIEIIQELNHFVFQHFADTELHLTFFAARLDLQRHIATYSGAGHPGPLLIRRGRGPVEVLKSQNLPLGVAEHCLSDEPEHLATLHRGDRLVFYTDGLTETADAHGKLLGEAGLANIAANVCAGSVCEVAGCILDRLAWFRAGPMRDDMTLIVAEVK